eukprot:CAMPEP_0178909672 /NCGR_PEP_ID=MMETSP0786-20121207/8661_1 /TAXON_ID=186022 /ORGANISM="Thalassionema frauenfeldii, Strain CCMP 1798" /LENGTH=962 /DNA_ID=CAMNT_0020581817 /DNA_START=143 /DNA_END=3032 /DNA_ORIENTATION=+
MNQDEKLGGDNTEPAGAPAASKEMSTEHKIVDDTGAVASVNSTVASQPGCTASNGFDDDSEAEGADVLAPDLELSVSDPIWKVNLADLQPSKLALRAGRLRFDDGSLGDFVYVPESYNFNSEEGFQAILSTDSDEPELVFHFPANFGVVPNDNYADTKLYWDLYQPDSYHTIWFGRDDLKLPDPDRDYSKIRRQETRVMNILDGISQACSQTSAVYLLTDPFRGNKMAEMACRSASQAGGGVVYSLGLFVCDEFTKVDQTKTDNRVFKPIKEGDKETKIPWTDRHDLRRVNLDRKLVFQNSDFVVTKGDRQKYAIEVTCNRTNVEESFYRSYRIHKVNNGLAPDCSHRLVFETKKSKERFQQKFLNRFPTGSLVVGSSDQELRSAVECIKAGRPVFVLEHTGISADGVAALLRYGEHLHAKRLVTDEEKQKYLYFNLPNSIGLWNQLSMSDKVWYDVRVMADTFQSLAPFYNPDANIIFNMNDALDVNKLQDDITKVMGSVFETTPELGGAEKDIAVISQAQGIKTLVATARHRYRIYSLIFQVFIRVVIVFAVLTTILQSQLEEEEPAFEVLKFWNIILPLVESALIALEASFRPTNKYANLLLAEKRIESECFRFQTRTGIYRNRGGMGLKAMHARAAFSERVQGFLKECMQSDVASGSLLSSGSDAKKLHDTLMAPNLDNSGGHPPVLAPLTGELLNGTGNVVKFNLFSEEKPEEDKRPDASENMFYSKEYNFDKLRAADGECLKKQKNETFYSRGYSFVPDAAFLKEEEEGHAEVKRILQNPKSQNIIKDDVLRAPAYVEDRLLPMMGHFYGRLPRDTFIKRLNLVLATFLLAAATAFVSLGLHEWVPLLLAAVAAFEYSTAYLQLETRIPNLNASATELTNIQMWWNGLTLIQSRQPSNKDTLVDRTEEAIISHYAQFAGATLLFAKQRHSAANELKNDEERGSGVEPVNLESKKAA